MKAEDSRVGAEYVSALDNVVRVFQSEQSIESATKDDLSQGLRGLHAFLEQLRFVKGGRANLTEAFWQANNDDQARVKKTVTYLLHGPGDFIQRLHDILYDRDWKIGLFAFFCAFELFGSIKPQEFPPINGRIAKGLRFIGFNVRGT